jgi:hypothetical protein
MCLQFCIEEYQHGDDANISACVLRSNGIPPVLCQVRPITFRPLVKSQN